MKAVWIRLTIATGVLLLLSAIVLGVVWKYAPRLQHAADRNKSPAQLRQEQAALEKMDQARRENVAELHREMDAKGGDIVSGTTARMDRAQALLDETARQFQGDERTAIKLLSQRLDELRKKSQAFERAITALKEASYLAPESLPDLAAIAERRRLVEQLLAANEALTASVRDLESNLRADFETHLTSKERAAEFARTFARSAHTEAQLKIREYDRQLGTLALAQLDLLATQWGAWKLDDTGAVQFTDAESAKQYEEQQRMIQAAAEAQMAVQQQMLAESERSAAANAPPGNNAAAIRPSPTPAASPNP
ncbi:MAG: hypothetical protein JO117_02315 [Verrucomicrobia bacterium]|nr:hypothetical protein [Verrucomicrobiota bacterium]